MVSKSAILEILIITGLKSDAILSVVDRNVAIFTTRHAITCYEFQVWEIADADRKPFSSTETIPSILNKDIA